jgi:RNA polymerase sigma-70 factor (ECF subfamily)
MQLSRTSSKNYWTDSSSRNLQADFASKSEESTKPLPASEAELVSALKAGEPGAFTEMVERYSGVVYNLALRLMRNDPMEAEDVLQETFISAFRALDRFEGRSLLSTWLYRIAYNAALMRLRKRELPTVSIDEPRETEEGDPIPRQLVDWGAVPDRILLDRELHNVLDTAVAALPETQRSVFVLRDIEGLSTAETAAILDLTETNVKVRLHRARLALRERLGAYFDSAQVGVGGRREPYVAIV